MSTPAWATSEGITFGTVGANFAVILGDGGDEDFYPDQSKNITGTIELHPSHSRIPSAKGFRFLCPVLCDVRAGHMIAPDGSNTPTRLVSTDIGGTWWWTAKFNIALQRSNSEGKRLSIPDISFKLPANKHIDLFQVEKLSDSTPWTPAVSEVIDAQAARIAALENSLKTLQGEHSVRVLELAQHLDSVRSGTWVQVASQYATPEMGYPRNLAGLLTATSAPNGNFIWQTYETYGTYREVYQRAFYKSATTELWSPWQRIDGLSATLPDTGWRDISSIARTASTQWKPTIKIRRVGVMVGISLHGEQTDALSGLRWSLPNGFRLEQAAGEIDTLGPTTEARFDAWTNGVTAWSITAKTNVRGTSWFTTRDPWPTSMPGTPA
ncbi:pyocin knob domain-containing protein [Devriesea agamarum]|uniref:pyocin knob domain-containing protein n=1 Tax=Devriesea agamarum TaxID=472569 RepID=UPI00071CF9C7|nr:pyocin knob domain-containing protein [Devriesea agamarum]